MRDGRSNDNQLPAGLMEYDDEKDDFPADLRIYGAIWYIYMMFTIIKLISKLVQWAEAVLVERDIRVWNSKRWKTKTINLFFENQKQNGWNYHDFYPLTITSSVRQ